MRSALVGLSFVCGSSVAGLCLYSVTNNLERQSIMAATRINQIAGFVRLIPLPTLLYKDIHF